MSVSGGGSDGIVVATRLQWIRGGTVQNNTGMGIRLTNTGNALVESTLVANNTLGGLFVNNTTGSTLTTIGHEDLSLALGNVFRDNGGRQLEIQNNARALGNTVYHTPEGDRDQTGTGIYLHSTLARHNLIYDASNVAVRMDGFARNWVFENNTIHSTEGNGLAVANAADGTIRNNIFSMQGGGVAIVLDTASQAGLQSNYNLFHVTGEGRVGVWAGAVRNNFQDWRNASFLDRNSLAANPLFVSPAGADGVIGFASFANDGRDDNFHLQSQVGSFHNSSLAPVRGAVANRAAFLTPVLVSDPGQSPGIDRGDAASSFVNEPATNGSFINLGAYGNTHLASLSPVHYVLVKNPGGGETWPMGQTFEIRWRSHNTGGTVDIFLRQDGNPAPVRTLAMGIANDGSFNWTLPTDLAPGADYRIEVVRSEFGVGQSIAQTLSLPAGDYVLRLHFATINGWQNCRFDIVVDGVVVVADFNPSTAAGGINRAHVVEVPVTVTDGTPVNLRLTTTANGYAYLNGVEVVAIVPGGVEDPRFTVRASLDGGATFQTVVTGVPVDLDGRGAAIWIPGASTIGREAIIQVVAESASTVQGQSALFLVANDGNLYYVNNATATGNHHIHGNNIGINFWGSVSTARDNTVFNNTIGIDAAVAARNFIDANLVYGNSNTGIRVMNGTLVTGNTAHTNGTGIFVSSGAGSQRFFGGISGNLVYNNTNYGLRVWTTTGQPLVSGNTIVQSGAASVTVLLENSAQNVDFRNNIVVAHGGQGLRVEANSQAGFSGDYNLFHFTGGATPYRWGDIVFSNIADWFYGTGADRHSGLCLSRRRPAAPLRQCRRTRPPASPRRASRPARLGDRPARSDHPPRPTPRRRASLSPPPTSPPRRHLDRRFPRLPLPLRLLKHFRLQYSPAPRAKKRSRERFFARDGVGKDTARMAREGGDGFSDA